MPLTVYVAFLIIRVDHNASFNQSEEIENKNYWFWRLKVNKILIFLQYFLPAVLSFSVILELDRPFTVHALVWTKMLFQLSSPISYSQLEWMVWTLLTFNEAGSYLKCTLYCINWSLVRVHVKCFINFEKWKKLIVGTFSLNSVVHSKFFYFITNQFKTNSSSSSCLISTLVQSIIIAYMSN